MLVCEPFGVLDTLLDIDPPDDKDGDDHHDQGEDESPTGIVMRNNRSSDQRPQPRRGLVRDTVEREELGFFTLGQKSGVKHTREGLRSSQHQSKVDKELNGKTKIRIKRRVLACNFREGQASSQKKNARIKYLKSSGQLTGQISIL